MPLTPEQLAREGIDDLLHQCGWVVQDLKQANLAVARGVAIREVRLQTGPVDYLLFVDKKPLGVIEAKKAGVTLSTVAEQSANYGQSLPEFLEPTGPLPFYYESTGVETFFRDERDPQPRSRRVFAFHRPETLAERAVGSATLRRRLAQIPFAAPLDPTGLRECQVEAITNLEQSLVRDDPRALIQMATGAGKTVTACAFTYRLIKHAGARRILFLVDRGNLGRQARDAFADYVPPDDGRKFSQLYNVQLLTSNQLDDVCRVTVCTIQRLYSMLRGEAEFNEEADEHSTADLTAADSRPREVSYNPAIPIEYFDFIVTDECHRSIYNLWRQVLEYFDAHLIGLTATPSKQTIGFFHQNLVMEYGHERAVADGVNVGYDVYKIDTQVTRQGGTVEKGLWIDRRSKDTRARRFEQLDEDLTYAANQLDRSVVVESQIRTVIRTFRDALPELFPGRAMVPKTLIFAKDDSHAEDIIHIVREVFGKGNDFAKKITYRALNLDNRRQGAQSLIREFQTSPQLRIAVTVDMIATGTDIKPLECLIFLRDVRSRVFFEQMKGRGTRVLSPTELQAVSGADAKAKTHFVIVDAVGVCESCKTESRPLERQPTISFGKLLQNVGLGASDENSVTTLAGRLARLDRQLTGDQRQELTGLAGGVPISQIAGQLLRSCDPDIVAEHVTGRKGASREEITDEQFQTGRRELAEQACQPFYNPALRERLENIKRENEQSIDTVTQDVVTFQGFDPAARERAETLVRSFREYIEQHQAQITALQILYSRPYKQRLTEPMLKELEKKLRETNAAWTEDTLWQAHAAIAPERVRGRSTVDRFADLVPLVRFALQQQPVLEPFAESVQARFDSWLAQKSAAGVTFTPDQQAWLELVRDHIATTLSIEVDDFDYSPFNSKGGLGRAHALFGEQLPALLDELNEVLAA
jgi:type I restriction enzyme R subunit